MKHLVQRMRLESISLVLFVMLNFVLLTSCKVLGNDVIYDSESSIRWSRTEILRSNLLSEDFLSNIKILPDRRDVILHVNSKEDLSLVLAVEKIGPLTLSVSPCYGILKWDLFWRPFPPESYKAFLSDAPQNETVTVSSLKGSFISNESISVVDVRTRRSSQSLPKILGNVLIIEDNFTVPMNENPSVKCLFKNGKPIFEVFLNHGEGREPWIFHKESAGPGLYIIRIRSLSEHSQLNALASRRLGSEITRQREMRTFKVKDNYKKHSVILSWNSRSDEGKLFCLAVSSIKFYSSLCAARDLQRSYKTLPPPLVDESLILGCTPNTFYNLPVTENSKYYISLWQQGTLVPFIQAIVQPKSHRKSHKLKPGKIVEFTLTNGGYILAKFNVKKSGKKLHVSAVSCYGGVKVTVLAGKERVAMAKGREALHLAIRRAPKAKLTIKVSPQPPIQALYRVYLVVSHSARRLPIPRLPKKVSIKAIPLNCTSAKILWSKAPGNSTYCVVLQKHPSGRPPEIRPPLQCGWEEVIRRRDFFDYIECFTSSKEKRQKKVLHGLPPSLSFLVNILVRHENTGRTLTLAPTMLNLPSCEEELKSSNRISLLNNKIFHREMSNEV
ncbi:UNVERIFIED_CONTAM: hypothetical protein RMT77_009442 [Armadillidium vulgare]